VKTIVVVVVSLSTTLASSSPSALVTSDYTTVAAPDGLIEPNGQTRS
jgi:hypothetical protein